MAVLLLVYVLVAGMLVPLGPGIERVAPNSAQAGESLELQVLGYNTRFSGHDGRLRAWLKGNDDQALSAEGYEVDDDRSLRLRFALPEYLPSGRQVQDLTLIVESPGMGVALLPSAVFVSQDSVDIRAGQALWSEGGLAGLQVSSGFTFPFRNILSETIRNTYFHVPLWFSMLFLFLGALVFSIRYLRHRRAIDDRKAVALTKAGILFGLLGLLTGAIWARFTWGAFWSWDIKQNMTAIGLLIYLAYFVLRNAFQEDQERQARLGAVYSIFAFATIIPLLYVIPRMTDSLHPGAGGNPAFGSQDLDNTMRLVFYPAVLGWTLLGFWIASLSYRAEEIKARLEERAWS